MKLLLLTIPICVTGFPWKDGAIEQLELADEGVLEVNSRGGDPLFEGDIILTEKQMEHVKNDGRRGKRQAYVFADRWTNNTVYFYFDDSIPENRRPSIRAAHEYIQSRTCVKFMENRTATNRVKVLRGGGCSSHVGMKGGEQELSLAPRCQAFGSAAHEFTHALGFLHAQTRSDRDEYLTIDESVIEPASAHNFDIQDEEYNYIFTPYDYGSIMQYYAEAFSNTTGIKTMIPKDPKQEYTMGSRLVSFYDIAMINEFYECYACEEATTVANCENGGYPNPRNCAICNCPRGYGGDDCAVRPPGCGEELTAAGDWKSANITVGYDEFKEQDVAMECTSWITAPEGKEIEVKLVKMENVGCVLSCQKHGIEIKAEDQMNTNPRYCCDEHLNKTIRSILNPTPIFAYNIAYKSVFTFEYRYVDVMTTADMQTTTKPLMTAETTAEDVATTEHEDTVAVTMKSTTLEGPKAEASTTATETDAMTTARTTKAFTSTVTTDLPSTSSTIAKGSTTANPTTPEIQTMLEETTAEGAIRTDNSNISTADEPTSTEFEMESTTVESTTTTVEKNTKKAVITDTTSTSTEFNSPGTSTDAPSTATTISTTTKAAATSPVYVKAAVSTSETSATATATEMPTITQVTSADPATTTGTKTESTVGSSSARIASTEAPPVDLAKLMVPLKRFVRNRPLSHRFHSSRVYEKIWQSKGFKFDEVLGKVISPSLYDQNKAEIKKQCGSLALIRSFLKDYAVITPNAPFARSLEKEKWFEHGQTVGYCSKTPKCGATKPLRAVKNKNDSVYFTNDNEIYTLKKTGRYGPVSGVLCYLF